MKQIKGIWFPDDDEHFQSHLTEDGDYQGLSFTAACQFVKDKKAFIDIGAHVGLWTLMAKKVGFKSFGCYEPNPKTFECLSKNVGSFADVFNQAVSKDEKTVQIIEDHKGNSGAISVKEGGTIPSGPIRVQSNKAAPVNECLLKVDVEGNELDVIEGCLELLEKARPVVVVEQGRDLNAVNYLIDLGMQVKGRVRKDVILAWPS